MGYSAKISRTGGSLKRLFVTKTNTMGNDNLYGCVEDKDYDYSVHMTESRAEIVSPSDIPSAWVTGLDQED